jgi:branched-subunit amino acid aminotransferase/4-amino-4-deoxychorismate lyase
MVSQFGKGGWKPSDGASPGTMRALVLLLLAKNLGLAAVKHSLNVEDLAAADEILSPTALAG